MLHFAHRALKPLFAGLCLGLAGIACRAERPPAADALTDADRGAIRDTIEAYRNGWLTNNATSADAVLGTFTSDAVLLPHHGDPPVSGAEAIRAYWFSPGPPTTIDALDITVEEIDGTSAMAFARGHDTVRWTTVTNGVAGHFGNTGTYLNVMTKGRDGRWRIRAHMWDDPANQAR